MKIVISGVVFFLFVTMFFGCAYNPETDPELAGVKQSIDRNISGEGRLKRELSLVVRSGEALGKQFKQGKELWAADFKAYKNEETEFVRGLTIDQLELYSTYEESQNEGSGVAKRVLSLRKLTSTFTDGQKATLIQFSDTARSLEERKQQLLEQQKEGRGIVATMLDINKQLDRVEQERVRILNYLNQLQGRAMVQKNRAYENMVNNIQNASQQASNTIQTNLQRQVMSNALQDIADAVRGY